MKQVLPAFFALFFVCSVQSQSNIKLHLAPRLGNAAFALNTPVSAGSYDYKITRLEYYISEIKITHDGGVVTPMTDLYLLVRPAIDSMYDLGAYPEITNVESITFSVGVDQAHNHLDPATYPASHPLAPQNPAMQWGWTAGYRFVAIEGLAGTNFANLVEVHALGDANYKTLTLATAAEQHSNGDKTIHLVADYSKVFNNINISGGLIVHGTTGAAVTVLNNMKNLVFSAETSAITDPSFEGTFMVSPNPASAGPIVATMTLPAGAEYQLTLTDMTGRVLLKQSIAAERQNLLLAEVLDNGVYIVQLWQNERPVGTEKLVVAK